MPLRDHFHPPVSKRLPWPSLHNGWCSEITKQLNRRMPAGFYALERMRTDGGFEIDVGTAERDRTDPRPAPGETGETGGVAVAPAPSVYTAPVALGSCPFAVPDVSEIRVFTEDEGKVVGAIELVRPRNKDRPDARQAFVGKCLDYLGSGVSLVVVDVVTTRRANLHNELVRALRGPAEVDLAEDEVLYASAYRPAGDGGKPRIEFWAEAIRLDKPLPTMPLRLLGNVFVPVELEMTYTQTCHDRLLR
ncbi:MAG: DUF4058 family protein [Gemmataceae bacterium]